MREFGIPFAKGLVRGLRSFPSPVPGEEELIECHNLMPSEHGLRGHEAFIAIGITMPGIDYFGLKDQSGVIWYLYMPVALVPITRTTIPVVTADGFTATDLTPGVVPYWLQVDAVDNLVTQMYIWPSEFTGDLHVTTAPPAIGAGHDAIDGLALRSMSGWKHRLSALTSGDWFVNRVGG